MARNQEVPGAAPRWLKREPCESDRASPEDVLRLHETGQDALFELELTTLEINADEKWMVEQLLFTYVTESVPPGNWADGLAAGLRAVRRDRARRTAESLRELG